MLQAKVKADFRFGAVTAALVNFTKDDWRPVPAGWEERLLEGYTELLDFRSEGGDFIVPAEHPGWQIEPASDSVVIKPAGAPEITSDVNGPFLDGAALGEKIAAALKAGETDAPGQGAAAEVVTPSAETTPVAPVTEQPVAEPAAQADVVLEAEAEADDQAAAEAESIAATERAAAAQKRAKKAAK